MCLIRSIKGRGEPILCFAAVCPTEEPPTGFTYTAHSLPNEHEQLSGEKTAKANELILGSMALKNEDQ